LKKDYSLPTPFFCGIEMTKKGGLNIIIIQYILGFAMNLFK